MRFPIVGGPHDGSQAQLSIHDILPEREVSLDGQPYRTEWQRGESPRLVFAG
jgi:hypothetical protein